MDLENIEEAILDLSKKTNCKIENKSSYSKTEILVFIGSWRKNWQ